MIGQNLRFFSGKKLRSWTGKPASRKYSLSQDIGEEELASRRIKEFEMDYVDELPISGN